MLLDGIWGNTICLRFSFFFQAADGIRDIGVTGVQTCALPISKRKTIKEVQDILNKEGKVISKWYKSNFLRGNYEKYQTRSLEDLEITMSNVKIKCGSELKLLQITIRTKNWIQLGKEQQGK